MEGGRNNTVVIFDFDCTIIDVDSDPWVAERLGATQAFDTLRHQMPWNDMMDALMGMLHSQGKTISDIEEALRSAPLQPQKITAIKLAHALGCELRVVSDANSFFIKTILDKYDVTHLFTAIHTNPSHVDEAGRLHIGPFHPKSQAPHGCPLCPPNMCKGRVIDQLRLDGMDAKDIIYIGDGKGDFCPTLRLSERDCVLPKEGFPLQELVMTNRPKVKASIYPWRDAQELEEKLKALILAQHATNENEVQSDHNIGVSGVVSAQYGTCGVPQSKLDHSLEVVSQVV